MRASLPFLAKRAPHRAAANEFHFSIGRAKINNMSLLLVFEDFSGMTGRFWSEPVRKKRTGGAEQVVIRNTKPRERDLRT
jgi:hypothetical protein